ncbi:hypothetical protein XAC3810_70002 [Xanthomonas citri pv. citri]|nr:hypothetical protein XAC3824_100002 [Xanthomonas citri pv. citri]CEE20244.1 hypothetical protein XAC908_100003 [Xanthomonas citri pv. citri]CEE44568.1 hypothetical protein XAC1083_90002 [Xanthomonas citri pv. citri]CEE45848.1 hypothetical protein XAC902_80003 [Xanthomonas citri pv. citri]CEE46355.1 hypothetical protein XAC3810_70002 [Xanthomonas citri pv. citri]
MLAVIWVFVSMMDALGFCFLGS